MAEPVRVFVSHSHKDDAFTARLVRDLKSAGADVWVDTTEIAYDDFLKKINEGLSGRQWLVLVMTPDSLKSKYVQMEVNAALHQVIEGRMRAVIPILAKTCSLSDIPVTWAPLHRYDATHDYASALAGLLRALGLAALSAPPPPVPNAQPASKPALTQPPNAAPGRPAHHGLLLVAGSKTDVGRQREQNEDACYALVAGNDRQASGLFIVADGMGPNRAGPVASMISVEVIRDMLAPLLKSTDVTLPLASRVTPQQKREWSPKQHGNQLDESTALERYATKLREAIENAHNILNTYGQEHPDARGLGSTLTAALIVEGTAYIANVGDSRTYLLHDGRLNRVTRDHSLVERLVEAGQIERDDVYEHPNRNLVYRSLGAGKADVDVDIFTTELHAGDALLLCSDGLWEMVRDRQIESILNAVQNPGVACDLLVERANENGGEENITAVLVRVING